MSARAIAPTKVVCYCLLPVDFLVYREVRSFSYFADFCQRLLFDLICNYLSGLIKVYGISENEFFLNDRATTEIYTG